MRTWLVPNVNRVGPGARSFVHDGETVNVLQSSGACCYRCQKPFSVDGDDVVLVARERFGDWPEWMRPFSFIKRQSERPKHYKVGLYHARCVPPNVFHAAAGSRPAGARRCRSVPAGHCGTSRH